MPKFCSNPISEHAEVPLADGGELESVIARYQSQRSHEHDGAHAYVVSVAKDARSPESRSAQLAEIVSLVENQGARVVGREMASLRKPEPRALFGKGMARDIAARARDAGASLIVLDAELSPSQARNLEDLTGISIADREAIILNVFLRNARSRRARIQVEIAQLEYLRPRIRGVGLDMDQQTGGMARARGPGETASELLARQLDGRLEHERKALAGLERAAKTQRGGRDGCERIVLVGYTNAGKTSLMNALTGASLSARDMPFETLDTTSRVLTRHGGDVVLSDTVGFIRRLPDRLLASFESTLAEISEASLLAIVVDVSDPERELHVRTTTSAIEKLGAGGTPRFFIWNKADRLVTPPEGLTQLAGAHPFAVLSARNEDAITGLRGELVERVRRDRAEMTVFVPYSRRDVHALVWGKCHVLESEATASGMRFRLRGARPVLARIRARIEDAR